MLRIEGDSAVVTVTVVSFVFVESDDIRVSHISEDVSFLPEKK
jgi:hypothetical protein